MKRLLRLLQAIQKDCLPGVWSRGIALAREGAVVVDRDDRDGSGEIQLRVTIADRPVSPKVTLWLEPDDSEDDGDYHCDCGDRQAQDGVCMHVAAAAIHLKDPGSKPASAASPTAAPATSSATLLRYKLQRSGGALAIERVLVVRGPHGPVEQPLPASLVAVSGGISSGRIAIPPLAATREDFAVDAILGSAKLGLSTPAAATMRRLIPALAACRDVRLDGAAVRAQTRAVGLTAEIVAEPDGAFVIRGRRGPAPREVFTNGAALVAPTGGPGASDADGGTLAAYDDPPLAPEERALLDGASRRFTRAELPWLLGRILPALRKKLPVTTAESLPELKLVAPRIVLNTARLSAEILAVTPLVLPPEDPGHGDVLVTDESIERMLVLKLRDELHLSPGQVTRFEGQAAVDFTRRMKGWEIQGGAVAEFEGTRELVARLSLGVGGDFKLEFASEPGSGAAAESADPARVMAAWARGETHVPLLSGAWARLPADWLARFGARARELLAARADAGDGALPPARVPEALALMGDAGAPLAPDLARLRERLVDFSGIPRAPLPADLTASLRGYQQAGVDWMRFMRETGLGALLADDMGLGKTVQAMAGFTSRVLVVAPTSVLKGWEGQLRAFRPGLRVHLHHGAARKLDPAADVTLVSYAGLRAAWAGREALAEIEWDTVVLDEAQVIRNPESQIAQAAFSLRAGFRLALSGTPIENRLDDLWSIFRFLNPGLFGGREAFRDRYANRLGELRARLKPFILRRLKRDVAPELPPRTETVLEAELSAPERETYQAILAATKREVAEGVDKSTFQMLELLLRLRQACCHPALVAGAVEAAGSSSKIDLLVESLTRSRELGHRALVFSQWTSFLDLIEPALGGAGIRYSRLDGSTRDRGAVVDGFQAADGPDVMLISLKAGGVGLTLTAADHVYLMDPWWNPAVEEQAADRVHRIGQDRAVLIHRIIASDTIEERVLELQKSKREIAGAILGEGGVPTAAVTREDLLRLLDP